MAGGLWMSVSQITTLLKCTTDTNHFLSIAKGQKYGKCPYVMTASCTSWWRHQGETFSALLDLYEGNPPVTGGFPSQRPVTRGFDVFLFIIAWTNGWANNRDACNLRRHCTHYDNTVMHVYIYIIYMHHQTPTNLILKRIRHYILLTITATLSVREITKSSSTFSATNISSNIVWLIQLLDTIQMKSNEI